MGDWDGYNRVGSIGDGLWVDDLEGIEGDSSPGGLGRLSQHIQSSQLQTCSVILGYGGQGSQARRGRRLRWSLRP